MPFVLMMLAMVGLACVRIKSLPWQLVYLALFAAASLALYIPAMSHNTRMEVAQAAYSIAFVPGLLVAIGRSGHLLLRKARRRG